MFCMFMRIQPCAYINTCSDFFKGVLNWMYSVRLLKYLAKNYNWCPNLKFLSQLELQRKLPLPDITLWGISEKFLSLYLKPRMSHWFWRDRSSLSLRSWITEQHSSEDVLKVKGSNEFSWIYWKNSNSLHQSCLPLGWTIDHRSKNTSTYLPRRPWLRKWYMFWDFPLLIVEMVYLLRNVCVNLEWNK